LGDKKKRNEMGGAWGRGKVNAGCLWGDLREGDHLEDLGLDGWIILKLIF
jgi:hypothetical protein